MKKSLVVIVLAVFATNCNESCPKEFMAAYEVGKQMLGDAFPPPPLDPSRNDCGFGIDQTILPGYDTANFSSGSTSGICAASASDKTCAACVKASCCAETLACLGDDACACLLVLRTPGVSLPDDMQCAAEDSAYKTEIACLADHCAKECPAR
jgi:hypothetical protein